MHSRAKLVGLCGPVMKHGLPYCKSLGREKGIGSNQEGYFEGLDTERLVFL